MGQEVIVWINGPFGVGKTSVATSLVEAIPDAILFDPERVGWLVRITVPQDRHGDFQNLPVWRETVVNLAGSLDHHYPGPIVVPMSIWKTDYFEQIVDGLRREHEVRHFTLLAAEEVLIARIHKSEETVAAPWRLKHLGTCLQALTQPQFSEHVDTDDLSIEEVSRYVAESIGLREASDHTNST